MEELKEMLAEEMRLRKKLTIILGILLIVLVLGGAIFLLYLVRLQNSLSSLMAILNELDIESLNTSIKRLSEVLDNFNVDALNTTLEETAKILSDVTEKMNKISSFSLFN